MVERPSWAVSDTDGIITTEDGRVQLGAGVFLPDGTAPASSRSGFLPGPTSPGQVTASATADNNVHVAAFQRLTQSTRGQGPYIQTLDAEKTIDILTDNPADSTNDRHDLIVGQQSDQFYGDTGNGFLIRHVVGTAASTPSDPTVDGSPDYYELARVRVTAGATEITDSMIDDLRPPESTVALGGVLPVADQAERDAIPSPYEGMTVYRADTDWLETHSLTSWRSPWFVSTPDVTNITDPMQGTFAHDENDNKLYRWDGSTWVRHFPDQPRLRYEKTTKQAVANFTYTKLDFGSERSDSGHGVWNSGGTDWTLDPGWWQVTLGMQVDGDSDTTTANAARHVTLASSGDPNAGIEDRSMHTITASNTRLKLACEFPVTSTRAVSIYGYQQADSNALDFGGDTDSFITIRRIGDL